MRRWFESRAMHKMPEFVLLFAPGVFLFISTSTLWKTEMDSSAEFRRFITA